MLYNIDRDAARVRQLHRTGSRWAWSLEGSAATYYTDSTGAGMFMDDPDRGTYRRQLAGTAQFNACETYSGTRRAILRYIREGGRL